MPTEPTSLSLTKDSSWEQAHGFLRGPNILSPQLITDFVMHHEDTAQAAGILQKWAEQNKTPEDIYQSCDSFLQSTVFTTALQQNWTHETGSQWNSTVGRSISKILEEASVHSVNGIAMSYDLALAQHKRNPEQFPMTADQKAHVEGIKNLATFLSDYFGYQISKFKPPKP